MAMGYNLFLVNQWISDYYGLRFGKNHDISSLKSRGSNYGDTD